MALKKPKPAASRELSQEERDAGVETLKWEELFRDYPSLQQLDPAFFPTLRENYHRLVAWRSSGALWGPPALSSSSKSAEAATSSPPHTHPEADAAADLYSVRKKHERALKKA